MAVQIGELVRLMVDQHDDAVFRAKQGVEAVKKTGRKKLVIAALWSEMSLAQPAIHAMGDGYDVYAVTDARLFIATLARSPH